MKIAKMRVDMAFVIVGGTPMSETDIAEASDPAVLEELTKMMRAQAQKDLGQYAEIDSFKVRVDVVEV